MKRWLAMDIGCYECGEPSGVVGVFDTQEEALFVLDLAAHRQKADWHGQHDWQVFDLTVVSSVHSPAYEGTEK